MAPRKRKAEADGDDQEVPKPITKAKRTKKAPTSTISTRVTRTMTTNGPRKAVFATAELIENVMLFLPAKTVFGVQRVCQQFRDIIATSTKLQEKLFLRLPTATEKETWVIVRDGPRGFGEDPSFVRLADSGSELPSNILRTNGEPNAPPCMGVVCQPSNILQHGTRGCDRAALRMWYDRYELVEFQPKGAVIQASTASSSWKQVYVTDSPCVKATVSFVWKINSKPAITGVIQAEVEESAGLTLGRLMESALEHGSSGGQLYKDGAKWRVDKDIETLRDLLDKLEEQTGKHAYFVNDLKIYLRDVIFPTEDEKRAVVTAEA